MATVDPSSRKTPSVEHMPFKRKLRICDSPRCFCAAVNAEPSWIPHHLRNANNK